MCFSAPASFSAGIVLVALGVAALKKTNHKSQLMFAAIPFIFGVQQLAEGVLWLSLPVPDLISVHKTATITFLFFAQILWPIWVPISIMNLEKRKTRNLAQKVLVVIGLVVGIYLAICLLSYPVAAEIHGHHILYKLSYPTTIRPFTVFLYAIATITPPLFSHIKRMWMLSLIIFISYLIAAFFYEAYVLSVWCFFSSVISISVYLIVLETNKKTAL